MKLYSEVQIIYGPASKIHLDSISELTSDKIGSLVVCKCIVTRTSDIRPELAVATYACDVCGFENYQEIIDK
jgi:DNA replicative helicase MCM subunit Mcm2 (Cdc46/Mcm family)